MKVSNKSNVRPVPPRPEAQIEKDPYGHLTIYYLDGTLEKGTVPDGDGFLGNWEEEGQSFLFFREPSDQVVRDLLAGQPHLKLQDTYSMSYEEWHGGPVEPLRIGSVRISPPWAASTQPSTAGTNPQSHDGGPSVNIVLDPGVVFGNGMHPTTHHCIQALEILSAMERLDTVIDLGTGTGLLAIAAVQLGCRRALAVDLNFLAVATAKMNIGMNHLENRILAVQGNAKNFVDLWSDLVISNIHYDVMKQLIGSEGFLRKKYFILSGLLQNQAQHIESLLYQYPVAIMERWKSAGWYSFLGKAV
jgi:ribosomal protein L11 methyltransferase